MPLYFFDIINGGADRDDQGTECASDEDMRLAAIRALPDVAREEIPTDGDRRFFTVVARNEKREAIYTATIAFSGIWLDHRAPA